MSLTAKITSAYQQALKAKDRQTTAAIRLLLAVIKNREIEKKAELEDSEVVKTLLTEAKKRREALSIYRQSNREELAKIEAFELKIINRFLPAMMTEAEISAAIDKLKQSGGLPGDFGAAMKLVMEQLQGRAEGKLVAEIIKSRL